MRRPNAITTARTARVGELVGQDGRKRACINVRRDNLPVLDNVPLPNPSTVQEFKTQTSLYDASQGRNGGGNIQVALKSGTSEFHGDTFFS